MKNLPQKVVRGFSWSLLQLIVSKGLGFVLKIILARFLFPEDYGLIGMTMVFANLLMPIGELGFTSALIQRKEESISKNVLNSIFTFSFLLGVLLYVLITFFLAEFVEEFYGYPEIKNILLCLGIILLIQPFRTIPYAILTRKLAFKQIALSELVSEILSGMVAIGLALYGFGYWSLVFQIVLKHIINVPALLYFQMHVPKFRLVLSEVKSLTRFGLFTSGTGFLNEITQNLDYMLLGKFTNARELGLYSFSFIVTDTFRSHLMKVINKVMYPVYSLRQGNPESLKNLYKKVLKINLICISPIMVFMIFYSKSLILFLLGEKWEEAHVLISLLALSVIIHLLTNSHAVLIRAVGRADIDFKVQFWKVIVVFIPSFVILVYKLGAIGAALAVCLNKLTTVVIAVWILKKLIGFGLGEYFRGLRIVLLACGVTSMACWLLINAGATFFGFGILAILLIYLPIIWWGEQKELFEYINAVRQK